MNKMSHGSERKMTEVEFHTLMNNAYKFLGVECQQQVTNSIFVEADKDKDSLITYVEYFQIINKYICKKTLTESKPEPVPQGK
jgi:Ca2+-binding EF-hand superfamily protein